MGRDSRNLNKSILATLPKYNEDGTEKHITCEDARYHVLSWDSNGAKCSVPNCEINRRRKKMDKKPYTITDKRRMSENQEHPNEACRVCGSKEVHSKEYGKPTMKCIKYLKNQISKLQEFVIVDEPYHDETGPM